ncbi:clpC [Symbiodinium necroappetens]|uniref:ClpC protein n=1 Tax=Symbiodinium necroappetens TaxID=1628268 RepID=A0A813CIW7_9DINO|nr:clpC [Symbiodinium necroappetens]
MRLFDSAQMLHLLEQKHTWKEGSKEESGGPWPPIAAYVRKHAMTGSEFVAWKYGMENGKSFPESRGVEMEYEKQQTLTSAMDARFVLPRKEGRFGIMMANNVQFAYNITLKDAELCTI